jgi:class 3 adenylate cyclase
MGLKEDLAEEVAVIFSSNWKSRNGNVVPESESLTLDNDAIRLDATVLYADLADSTILVDKSKPHFAAEIYKVFLHCAAKIINSEDGEITAYDGDRIMAVFIGDYKNSSATRAALKINCARIKIINPAIKTQYADLNYQVNHVVGIDTSPLFIARTGVRGANDLVWVGGAANHAAKLSSLSSKYPTRITSEVYNKLPDKLKFGSDGEKMWEEINWVPMNRTIYRSTWLCNI